MNDMYESRLLGIRSSIEETSHAYCALAALLYSKTEALTEDERYGAYIINYRLLKSLKADICRLGGYGMSVEYPTAEE